MTAPPIKSPLADRILRTFLRLVAERGIDATTTRVLAEEAAVNEVTIFRLFGDKANLVSAAVRHFQAADELERYPLSIDASSPERASQGLLALLDFLRKKLLEHPEFLQFGMAEYWRFPQLKEDISATPRAAHALMLRALAAAKPALQPDLDLRAASLTLHGLLLVSVAWPQRGWIELSDAEWRLAAEQAVRCLLRERDTVPRGAAGFTRRVVSPRTTR